MAGVKDQMIGRVLGGYTITRLIAKGGMGRVYEATDNQINRRVAIKVITLEEEVADELVERFQREARVIGHLDNHPNIVTIYRYDQEDDLYYIAMKYVEGESLAEYTKKLRAKNQTLDPEELIHILRQVAAALDYAHDREIIHRDVKPANIMLEDDPALPKGFRRAILMDFGLVMRVNNTITTGSAFGTPRYISPEQAISSAQANPQSDHYSLGVLTYEILVGKPPFDDQETPIAVALSHVTKPPPDPRLVRPGAISDETAAVLLKALEKKPEDRYQRAQDFVEALHEALQKKPSREVMLAPPIHVAPPPTNLGDKAESSPSKKASKKDKKARREPKERKKAKLPLGLGIIFVILVALTAFLVFDQGFNINPFENASDDLPVVMADPIPSDLPVASMRVLLDGNTLAFYNPNDFPLRLVNVELRQGGQRFSLDDFGGSVLAAVDSESCAAITTFSQSRNNDFNLPSGCPRSTTLLRYLNASTFVWANTEPFMIYQDGRLLGQCAPQEAPCTIDGITQASNS